MDRLSSCYFCGDALDASLEEYPVVPGELQPSADAQKSVVLCGGCQRKLDAVLGTVVAAVDDRSAATSGGDVAADPGANSDGTTDDASDIEATLGDDEDVLRSVGSGDGAVADPSAEDAGGDAVESESSDEGATDGSDGDESDDGGSGKKRKYTESRGAGFTRDRNRRPNSSLRDSDDQTRKYSDSRGAGYRREDDRSNGSRQTSSGSSNGESSDGGSANGESSDGGSSSDGRENSPSSDSSATGSSGDGPESGSSADGSSVGDEDTPEVSLSRLENTKVMRLLENREFPVDKAEFVTVAASAYQISRDDCETVLDLAIEHGLIREEDGQIVGGDL